MTVKELFLSVGFDNVLNALRNTHRNDRSIEGVVAYKEAFDIICLTEFEGKGGEVTFDVTTPREAWYEPHNLPLLANNVEGDYWKNTVGKTVVKPDDNPFTDAELAGAILWGMTFYGFTRHAGWSPREERFTSFGAFSMEAWNQIHHGEMHQNRAKRKRYYRLKKRIAELKRLDKRQHLIDTIHEKCGFNDPQLESRIMNAGSINETWRDSHVADLTNRTNYLDDLLTNYFPTFRDICEGGEELLVVTYTSETSPLTDEEERNLTNMVHSFDAQIPITFIKGVDNDAKTDIALQFIIISSKPINDEDDD